MGFSIARIFLLVSPFTFLAVMVFSVAPGTLIADSLDITIGEANKACLKCHEKQNRALYMEWERSRHAQSGVGCVDCHEADASDVDAWKHAGTYVSVLVTPKDCSACHNRQYEEFNTSHHAKAGEILASLDNVLAEKVAGLPDNRADAVNGCWQCHGSIIKYQRNETGDVLKDEKGRPVLDPDSWPNSGMGRLNPDGSKGSCHACHSRHAFEAKLARNPENCGKCHMGPDHPQIEIYEESKHGIAFHASKDHMTLDGESWILGKVYSAAPSCSTCHISGYMTPKGEVTGNTHDVGDRISRTLRPVISSKLNRDTYGDGFREDFPQTRELPAIGDTLPTWEKFVDDGQLVTGAVARTVKQIATLEERREALQAVFKNYKKSM